MEHTTIAVDLAKSVFQVAVSRKPGRVDAERRLSRDRFLEYFVQQPPATVLLEAGVGAPLGAAAPAAGSHRAPVARARCPPVRPPKPDRSHRREGVA